MKSSLFASCSAIAVTLASGCAWADAPGKFDIKMGGDMFFEAGIVNQQQAANAKSYDFVDRFRLNIIPTAEADNGLKYGAHVRLRASKSTGIIDADLAYLFVEGNFGSIRGGMVDGPSDDTWVGIPLDSQIVGHWDRYQAYLGGTPATGTNGFGQAGNLAWGQYGSAPGGEGVDLLTSQDDHNRLNYYTPRWSGLQLAFGYSPRSNEVGSDEINTGVLRNTVAGANQGQQTAAFDDVWEATFNYDNTFSGVELQLGGGYSGGSALADAVGSDSQKYHDLESAQFGAQVSYAGATLGGSYLWAGKSGYTKAAYVTQSLSTAYANGAKSNSPGAGLVRTQLSDMDGWIVGGQYIIGPLAMGVHYQWLEDAGNVSVPGDRTLGSVVVSALYTVAPGLRVGGEYTHFDSKSDLADVPATNTKYGDSGDVVILRTIVNF